MRGDVTAHVLDEQLDDQFRHCSRETGLHVDIGGPCNI
jgi:hypothetical protein